MEKRMQRVKATDATAAITEQDRAAASAQICRRLTELPEVRAAKTVFSYLSTPKEADLTALHEWMLERGCAVAFPVTQEYGIMQAYVPRQPWRFSLDRFGIRAPIPVQSELILPEEIDVVLVPCVAFDSECRRLGHGGGYYDRYLPQCGGARLIGVAFEAQRLEQIVCNEQDVPLHAVVTEKTVYFAEK